MKIMRKLLLIIMSSFIICCSNNASLTNEIDNSDKVIYSLQHGSKENYYIASISEDIRIDGHITIPDEYNGLPVSFIRDISNQDISSITIGKNVQGIDYVHDLPKLKELIIPDNVHGFYHSFYKCDSLERVVLGSGVQSITNSFYSCHNLKSFNIPSAVTQMWDCFYDCPYLSNITSESDNFICEDGIVYNSTKDIILNYPSASGEFIISDSIKEIGARSFSYCSKLTSVVINNNITNIPFFAFSHCENLINVKFGESIEALGDEAFSYCSLLKRIVLPERLTSIASSTFLCCESLEEFIFENNDYYKNDSGAIIDIANSEMIWCLMTIDNKNIIPDYVKVIGRECFYGNSLLKEIVVPNSVRKIEASAFGCCSQLMTVTFLGSMTFIGSDLFQECKCLTEIIIPDGITTLPTACFFGCSSLSKVKLTSDIQKIESWVFADCENLKEINYDGNMDAWRTIYKDKDWLERSNLERIICLDGEIEVSEN